MADDARHTTRRRPRRRPRRRVEQHDRQQQVRTGADVADGDRQRATRSKPDADARTRSTGSPRSRRRRVGRGRHPTRGFPTRLPPASTSDVRRRRPPWRAAAMSASRSRMSMVSRPWMVDSAPELRFTLAVTLDAVVGAAGGGVIHRLAGRVVAEEPRRGDAGDMAEAGAVAGFGRRQQRLDTGMGAVGDLDALGRRGQPPVLGARPR